MISLKMLDAQGNSLERASVFSIYSTDMRHVPFNRKVEFRSSGEIRFTCAEYPVMFNALVCVPDYGRTWVTIDNCGQGYQDGAEIEFIREGALSRVFLVEREIKKGSFTPSPKCLSLLNDAKTLIKLAETSAKACEYNMKALGAGLWSGELLAVERAKARIAAGVKKDDFLFGTGAFNYPVEHLPGAREMLDSVSNYSTLPFYLGRVEPEKGKPSFTEIEKLYEEYTKGGMKTKGHPLWWGFESAGKPDWAKGYGWDEVKKTIEFIGKDRASRYRGRVEIFDVINEAHDWANAYNLTQAEQVEATKIACDSTHEGNPDAAAVINICLPYGEYAGQGKVLYGPVFDRIACPYSYFEMVRDRGIEYEIMGIQLYNPGRDMLSIELMLDRFAEFGKPIHITELGVPSYMRDVPYNWPDGTIEGIIDGIWHDFTWNERLQADWLEDFYTLCYAHPSIGAATWWNLTDPGWCPGSGFLSETGEPKEVFFRLKALEKSWGFDFGKK